MDQPSPNSDASQAPKRKRLLLVDADVGKRAVRAKILGEAGLDVDCAGDTIAARVLWRANSYHLVLIDLRDDAQGAAEFCAEIKTDSPRQNVSFLVGKPAYLSPSPNPEQDADITPPSDTGEKAAMLLARDCKAASIRGPFQEATLRMVAKRRSLFASRPEKTSARSFGEAVRRAQDGNRVAP